MIELRNVSINKSGQKLFHDFSWRINQGEHILISGANGSGKTTLLEVLAGVTPVAEGEIHYDFISGTTWEERYQQRKRAIHYLPADAALTQIHQHDLFYQQRYYSLGDEFVPLVKDFLGEEMVTQIHQFGFPASLSIDHLLQLKLTRLSNGQQKRVMILKNLAQQTPKVLLLDYPFEALDRQSRKDLAQFLNHIATEHGVQLILTDHDSELPSVVNMKIVLHHFQLESQSEITTSSLTAFAEPQTRNDSADPVFPVVEMKRLTIQYGETIIIKDLNWTINRGERWALAGKNGSGKTTLFSLIFADHPLAYSQQVYLFGKRRGDGESIWDIKSRITYLGPEQMSYLDPKEKLLTARDLLQNRNTDQTRLSALTDYFDAGHFINRPMRMLSSGQLQLVLIIQCFLFQKELLLLDEPFRFLDPVQKEKINQYLQLHLDKETTLVLITHDEQDMRRWGMQTLWL